MSRLEARWVEVFPDPAERRDWREVWGTAYIDDVEQWHRALPGADPYTAREWRRANPGLDTAAYLHGHGVAPLTRGAVTAHFTAATRERTLSAYAYTDEYTLRACLSIVHPHLTREDRDAITAATLLGGVPLTEIDHAIATGTYDRDALTVLTGLR